MSHLLEAPQTANQAEWPNTQNVSHTFEYIQASHKELETAAAVVEEASRLAPIQEFKQLMIKNDDAATWEHSYRVAITAVIIGQRHGSLSPRDLLILAEGGLCHDVGREDKAILDTVKSPVHYTGKAREQAMAVIKGHPLKGALMIYNANGWGKEGAQAEVAAIAVGHHAEVDEPYGIVPTPENELATEIVTIADEIDALASRRSYKPPLSLPETRAELEANIVSPHKRELIALAFDFSPSPHYLKYLGERLIVPERYNSMHTTV